MARKGGDTRGIYSRTNTDGSLVWYARYSAPIGSGRKEFREVAGPTKEHAVALYQRRKTEIREGRFDPTSLGAKARKRAIAEKVEAATEERWTLARAINHYLPRKLRKRDGTPKPAERVYLETLQADYWKALMGDVLLEDLTPRDLRDWQQERLNQRVTRGTGRRGVAAQPVRGAGTVKSSTVNRQLAWLKRILTWAYEDEILDRHPGARVKQLDEPPPRKRYLEPEEEERLRDAMRPDQWILVDFALSTGLRRQEMFRLRWADLDEARGILTVRKKSRRTEDRHVPLDAVADLLPELRRLAGRSEFVFPIRRGKLAGQRPMNWHNFTNRTFRAALQRAGIVGLTWHDLRRTFCSRLAQADVDLQVIRDLAGHESMATTEGYAYLQMAQQRAALATLNRHKMRKLPSNSVSD